MQDAIQLVVLTESAVEFEGKALEKPDRGDVELPGLCHHLVELQIQEQMLKQKIKSFLGKALVSEFRTYDAPDFRRTISCIQIKMTNSSY